MILAAALLAAAVAIGADVSAGAQAPRLGTGCSRGTPSTEDLRYAREYRRLLAEKAAAVWPGWRRMAPLLQRKGRCEYLIGHPSPPRSFSRVAGVDVLGWRVYTAPVGTLTPAVVASTWKVGAVWVAMVPTRDEFQRAVDRQLGPGSVRLNDTAYLRSLVHEAFHAHQMSATRGAPPSYGSTLEERQAGELLSRLGDAEARLAAEGRALSEGLTASSLSAARRAAAVFAAARAERRAATGEPKAVGAFERQIEWAEGTARYVDLRLVLLAGARGYVPTKGIRYTPAAAYRRAFLTELADSSPRRDGLRGRWQSLGAAQAMLLDRLAPGWKAAVLPGRSSLEDVVREALEVPTAPADLRLAEHTFRRNPNSRFAGG